MHQLGRPGRRPARQVIHFTKENGVAPARRIARDAAAIDAASDNGEVKNPIQLTFPRAAASSLRRLRFRFGIDHKQKRKQDENGNGPPELEFCHIRHFQNSTCG
jgi:hypothetical protein